MKKLIGILAVILLLLILGWIWFATNFIKPRFTGITDRGCTVTTATTSLVGRDVSVKLLATSSGRAWARLQQPHGTSTIYLALNDAAAATTSGATTLALNATSSMGVFELGRDTNFKYIGAVSGITDNGTTTVKITECTYVQ